MLCHGARIARLSRFSLRASGIPAWGLLLLALLAGCGGRAPADTFNPPHYRNTLDRGPARGMTFGTYNVHGLAKPDRLAADFKRLAFVDAWAMQEVVVSVPDMAEGQRCDQAVPALERILPEGRWHIVYVPVNRAGDDAWEGQAVVSRWPIRRVEVWHLPHHDTKHRVALAAWLDTPDGPLLFVNTDHEIGAAGLWPGTAQRGEQVHGLLERLAPHAGESIVVAGDFNSAGNALQFTSSTGEIRQINDAMSAGGFAPLPNGFEDAATFHVGLIQRHLDHLFLRNLTCETWDVASSSQGSDHRPAWCRVSSSPQASGWTSR